MAKSDLTILLVIGGVAAVAGWYFLMGPGSRIAIPDAPGTFVTRGSPAAQRMGL